MHAGQLDASLVLLGDPEGSPRGDLILTVPLVNPGSTRTSVAVVDHGVLEHLGLAVEVELELWVELIALPDEVLVVDDRAPLAAALVRGDLASALGRVGDLHVVVGAGPFVLAGVAGETVVVCDVEERQCSDDHSHEQNAQKLAGPAHMFISRTRNKKEPQKQDCFKTHIF